MPVKLDKVPAPLNAPATPRAWFWLLLLVVLLLAGVALALWLAGDDLAQQPDRFWLNGLGAPLVIWCVLGLLRVMAYAGESGVAEGWNDAREEDMAQRIRRGRRSQQVLAVSLHTASRELGAENGDAQLAALHGGHKVLTVQPDWQASEDGARHSRLAYEQGESPETLLRRVLRQVLGDIAQVLERLPDDQPLALLLDMSSSLTDHTLNELWQDVWAASGIRQPTTLIEGSGLSVVDGWLDQRIQDPALLLVVAFQLAPADAQNTAEAVTGVLFGNRLTQTVLEPVAYLHRPEQERKPDAQALLDAARQALDWVPVEASSIQHAWIAGADFNRTADISAALSSLQILAERQSGLHDLGTYLGNPDCAAAWVAVAASVESIRAEPTPHFVFSRGSTADARLWCSVVMPPSAG
ncbi:MAG TPA: hypothetical protein VF682_21735 [Pseudomonas sp.]|jgi:hypothetical protein